MHMYRQYLLSLETQLFGLTIISLYTVLQMMPEKVQGIFAKHTHPRKQGAISKDTTVKMQSTHCDNGMLETTTMYLHPWPGVVPQQGGGAWR